MRKPALLIAAVAAALMALVPLGMSEAATVPAPHQISLRVPFSRALTSARVGHIAGVVPPLGRHVSPRRLAAAACAEPNCNLTYHGGVVQSSPHVYLLLWGPNWPNTDPVYGDLSRLYSGLGTASDTWSTVSSQYGPAFSGTVFAGTWQDTSSPPSDVTPADLSAEASAFASAVSITGNTNAQVVIASQHGTCFSDGFAGSCGSPQPSGFYCGWHDYNGNVPYTNLPYTLDAGQLCGQNWINKGSSGLTDGVSTIAAHEYAETATDPEPASGWTDNADTISGGEIGDKCAWGGSNWSTLGSDTYGNITLPTGTFAMQSLWSNAAGRCLLTTHPTLSITKPPAQLTHRNHRVHLQIHASTNTGAKITFHASGLPTGLHISTSGLITGTATKLGTWTPKVTASTYAGSKSTSFTWRVVR